MLPGCDVDLFTDDLADPYDGYRMLRDLGPVVRLTAHDVYAVTRYAEVRAVLEDPEVFCSGQGVGFNDFINDAGRMGLARLEGAAMLGAPTGDDDNR